ncbi:hypothetical protein BTUL_0119g00220 [Botrytis tulipae]|uniref:Uncharacterized protein n=1 Tax=Botrytis tulipae TaxID=87230 RepID=A0A4Z1EJM2_9HELO|nr:hypothetical protein BTUL_0119g00220 [Botrytis tulipae]
MPNVLGAGLRWLRGEKGKSFKEPIEACVGPDVIESRRLHQMARNMGLESDSEEECLNNRTVRSERHCERVKHRPPPEKHNPEGSSRSGTIIDYGKTGGYQRSIWLKSGDHSSDSDRLPRHDSPQVKNTGKSSDYPNTNLGPSGKPWGQQSSFSQSAPDDYSIPYKSSGNSHVGSPREAAELSTSANSSEYVSHVDRSAHESNNRRGPLYPSQRLPSPHLKFDPVRYAAAQNDVISRRHSNYEAPISSRVIPARKPVPHSNLQHLSIAIKEAKELNSKHLAELEIINRRNEEEVFRQRRARKLINSPQESEESDEDYYGDTPRGRRQHEEDKRLFKNYQARQGEGKLLPPPLPPKLPLSLNHHPSPPSRSAKLAPEFSIPSRPTSLMRDEPQNSWPSDMKFPPDHCTKTVMPPPRRTTVSSSAWENNPRAPPYPVSPHNYHLNGYNNQNDVQKRAVHDAFKDMMLHGHERIAGPTPPTFRSSYPDAVELSGVSPEIRRDGMRRHTPGGNEVLGDRSQRPGFAVRIDMGIYRPAIIQETEEERAGGGISGVARMETIGDRRRERLVPEIRVQHPTPITSLREPHGVNIGRTRRSAEIERLVAPRSDHGERRKHEKHEKYEKHEVIISGGRYFQGVDGKWEKKKW